MNGRDVVVIGATNTVGATASALLEQRGFAVRRVSRRHGIDVNDRIALHAAFGGAWGAYVVVPFDKVAPDLHAYEAAFVDRLADAIANAGVQRVVALSGLNAHLAIGTSFGATLLERRMQTLPIAELVILRAGFFMENFVKGMDVRRQAATGSFASPFRGDRVLPLIAERDVGVRVAELLGAEDAPQPAIQELHGGSWHTLAEATGIMGRALGVRELNYVQVGPEEAGAGMTAAGFSASFADAVAETAASFNAGEQWERERRSPSTTTPTSFEQWAAETLASSIA